MQYNNIDYQTSKHICSVNVACETRQAEAHIGGILVRISGKACSMTVSLLCARGAHICALSYLVFKQPQRRVVVAVSHTLLYATYLDFGSVLLLYKIIHPGAV